MSNKITVKSKNRRFQQIGLIFYCYLLITLNELALNTLNINKIKIAKKIPCYIRDIRPEGGKRGFGVSGQVWLGDFRFVAGIVKSTASQTSRCH